MEEESTCIYYLLACKTWEFNDTFCNPDSFSDTLIGREIEGNRKGIHKQKCNEEDLNKCHTELCHNIDCIGG